MLRGWSWCAAEPRKVRYLIRWISSSRAGALWLLSPSASMFCKRTPNSMVIAGPSPLERTCPPMAQKVHITLEDDLDGGDAAETVAFGLDGRSYEIDLNAKNAKALRDALAKYVAAGRRAGGRNAGARRRTQVGTSAREIRDWARSHGHKVPDRGRIPADIREAFEAAH
jgi:Lsr2